MDVEKVFRMNEGTGDKSYAKNSSFQKKCSEMVNHITIETIVDLYFTDFPEILSVADLGCASGSNSLSVIETIVDAVDERCRRFSRPPPEFRVFLNDLPTNDFNCIFRALPEFYQRLKQGKEGGFLSCYIAGVPGSFYGRLFPSNSLHFVHSSLSLHWLSQVPPALVDETGKSINKGKLYISETSSTLVFEAYLMQFQKDFSLFLKSRSQEMISGGRMVLTLLGRRTTDPADRESIFLWELLAQAFAAMISEGQVEEEKVDSYNVPFYNPCAEEIQGEVEREGSFRLDRLDVLEMASQINPGSGGGRLVAMAVRAIQESMICQHFGERLMNGLFEKYAEILEKELVETQRKEIIFVVAMRKI